MDRKLIRPSLGRPRPAGGAPARRPSPPAATNAEASYLLNAQESKVPLVVKLLNGKEFRGRVEFYDRDSIKLSRDGRPGLLLRKEQIKYYWMERDAGTRP